MKNEPVPVRKELTDIVKISTFGYVLKITPESVPMQESNSHIQLNCIAVGMPIKSHHSLLELFFKSLSTTQKHLPSQLYTHSPGFVSGDCQSNLCVILLRLCVITDI